MTYTVSSRTLNSTIHTYLLMHSEVVHVLSRPTREELEAITMEPTRIVMDQNWLASHVRGVCGGQMPPLVGPYAVPYLVAQLEGMRKHFIDDDDSVC